MPHTMYVALSQSLRDVLPVKALIQELMAIIGTYINNPKLISKLTVYEDSNSAIWVATCPKLTPTWKVKIVRVESSK
eukprot:9883263-Ditylum_brightwellii.AAC.1